MHRQSGLGSCATRTVSFKLLPHKELHGDKYSDGYFRLNS
jgi:hypothetical protein